MQQHPRPVLQSREEEPECEETQRKQPTDQKDLSGLEVLTRQFDAGIV